jgi:hopene-associated glycosyltransferase HpnB
MSGVGSTYARRFVGMLVWEIAAWIVTGAWAYLLFGHGHFWSTAVRLPAVGHTGRDDPVSAPPHVTIIVPARDEADLVTTTIPALVAQDYRGVARIVVVDDGSRDETASVARRASQSGGLGLDVIDSGARPEGWMGKTWALEQGVAHATTVRAEAPEWFLFTDADILHPPDSLRRLMGAAVAWRRDAVSLMARLPVNTVWERLNIPAFVYFFSQLYPFRRVAGPGRTAAAAGGCILVRREALEAAGGIGAVRGAVIDDVALARRLKRSGSSIWLGYADDVRSIRPYPRLADLWSMVARSAFTQLRHSALLLLGTVCGLAVLYLGPLTALLAGLVNWNGWLAAAGITASVAMAATYLPMIRYFGLRWPWSLTLPAAASMYAAMTVDSARRHWEGRGVEWKGRRYQPSHNETSAPAAARRRGPTRTHPHRADQLEEP